MGIMNVSGDIMVEYTYDAWGNVLSITGPMASTMGQHNQLRYRGYVYDPETSLYYLNSRYYNPETGRFINADAFASTGQGMLGNNMFAYCLNNPVNAVDPTGYAGLMRISINDDPTREIFFGSGGGGMCGGGGGGGGFAGRGCKDLIDELSEIGEDVESFAEDVFDAAMRGVNIQQNAQMQESQMLLEGATTMYDYLNDTEVIDIGIAGYHSVQAAREGKKALAYWVAPIPFPVDESFAIAHGLRALYHLYHVLTEVFT